MKEPVMRLEDRILELRVVGTYHVFHYSNSNPNEDMSNSCSMDTTFHVLSSTRNQSLPSSLGLSDDGNQVFNGVSKFLNCHDIFVHIFYELRGQSATHTNHNGTRPSSLAQTYQRRYI